MKKGERSLLIKSFFQSVLEGPKDCRNLEEAVTRMETLEQPVPAKLLG